MCVRPGIKAPDFRAQAYLKGEVKEVKLEDYQGKWLVLCFYPGDFSPVCATEIASLAYIYPELQELGAELLAISVDSIFTHKVWYEVELAKMLSGEIPFPLAWDKGAQISQLYGVFHPELGLSMRGRFIIDPDGFIQATEMLNTPVGRHVSELLRLVEAFKYVREHPGEVCPAGWMPGDPTLKAFPALAGKVWDVWKPQKA
ncbi:thioredoxin-dependent peroxiredoxin [Thermodesulfatator atlanticus]|uniref:thioredoxin-dependent peroxiredoxin n=1 Tax=Thermodesulfatator atlanticus TaxID=501497 RepID=UPI0003B3D147|nr:thioredoxin-dependent peroxiredoxin [Thermodesulfatator atlanticus]